MKTLLALSAALFLSACANTLQPTSTTDNLAMDCQKMQQKITSTTTPTTTKANLEAYFTKHCK